MSKRETFLRYSLIIKQLRAKPLSFKDLDLYLSSQGQLYEYKLRISQRTFQRDIDDIRSLFHIDIRYSFSNQIYFIAESDEAAISIRMLEAFDTFQALQMANSLASNIHLDSRPSKGTENLYAIVEAIKRRIKVKFFYQKFWNDEISERLIDPYALKEFKQRWYVIGRDNKDFRIKTFALDRIDRFDSTKQVFSQTQDFNLQDAFEYSFGIIESDKQRAKKITLSFSPVQGKYLKTQPLHHSQEIILDNEQELQITLKLSPSYDFIMELLSFGGSMKVLEPSDLAKTVAMELKKAYSQYENAM